MDNYEVKIDKIVNYEEDTRENRVSYYKENITNYFLTCLKDDQDFVKFNMLPKNNMENIDTIIQIRDTILNSKDGEFILFDYDDKNV